MSISGDANRRGERVSPKTTAVFFAALAFLAMSWRTNVVEAQSTDGTLDFSWGQVDGGKVLTDVGGASHGTSLAIQGDGKAVIAGSVNQQFGLTRYNTDGSLDSSFGSGGKVTTAFPGGPASIQSIALQSDGRIVAAGVAASNFALARYNTDGSLDQTFGSGGMVTTDFAGGYDEAYAVAIQADGKILAAGASQSASNGYDFALARYGTNGALDTSFGTGGKVTTDFASSTDIASAMVLQSNGKIVLAGRALVGGVLHFALARYSTNGALDSSFGSGGKVMTALSTFSNNATCVLIQPDGKILAGGQATVQKAQGPLTDFAMVRYLSDGSLDPSFGTNSFVLTDFQNLNDQIDAIALQSDGKILAAGTSYYGTLFQFASARYENSVPRPTQLFTFAPCRLIDTRNPAGPNGGPALSAGQTQTFTFAGNCGIPATAAAVAINVTVVNATSGPGSLTLYPGGGNLPPTSTVSYNVGPPRANNAVSGLGPAGDLSVHCSQASGTVDLIIDVSGYFQ